MPATAKKQGKTSPQWCRPAVKMSPEVAANAVRSVGLRIESFVLRWAAGLKDEDHRPRPGLPPSGRRLGFQSHEVREARAEERQTAHAQ